MNKINNFIAYTDGSCHKPGGEGGFGFVLLTEEEDIVKSESIYSESTTSQREEIRALTELMMYCSEHLISKQNITIYTDSNYGMKGCNSWMKKWQANGWLNSKKEVVAHVDLWQTIYSIINDHNYTIKKVKAHNDNYWNDYVDDLAKKTWKKNV